MPSLQARMIAKSVHGHATQDPLELAEFLDVLLDNPPRVVVEIGLAFGGTMQAWMRAAADEATLVGVDLALEPTHLEYEPPKRKQNVHLLAGDSQHMETYYAVADALQGRSVDFLFIDGEHTEEAARSDYEMYSPLVRSGGIIAFHDAAGNNPVKAAIAALGLDLTLIHNAHETRHKMGIGWMRVP